MRTISLHDTLTGEVRALEPREPGRVGIYACGSTVYGRIHVGNARPFVVFSLLKSFSLMAVSFPRYLMTESSWPSLLYSRP